MLNSISHDVTIKSSSALVFDKIVNPEHLNNWWPLKSSGDGNLNDVYNFYFSEEYDWFSKLIKVEKNKEIQFLMTHCDEDWNDTILEFKLEIINTDNTLLKFSHIGWKNNNHHFRRTSYCWALLLKGLKDYCEKGTIVPFKNRG
mgnify:CR=1 FL=1